MGADGAFEFLGGASKTAGFVDGGKRGHHVVLDGALGFIGQTRAKHEDGPATTDSANVARFVEIGYAENVRAGLHQERGNLPQPMAISIGLYHRHQAGAGAEPMAEPRDIAAQCIQVDFRPASVTEAHARDWRRPKPGASAGHSQD